jgi:hypothetical protein
MELPMAKHMAVLEVRSDVRLVSLTVRGLVDRAALNDLRAALWNAGLNTWIEIDLREVTEFPRLGVAVLVSARHWFGDRLRIRGNPEVLALVEDAGLTRVLHFAG